MQSSFTNNSFLVTLSYHTFMFFSIYLFKIKKTLPTSCSQYLGSKDDRTACLLKCFGWFGTEEEYLNYDIPSDGRITVYAETFENQTVMGTTWSIKGLTRPEFSNPDGKVLQFLKYFILRFFIAQRTYCT